MSSFQSSPPSPPNTHTHTPIRPGASTARGPGVSRQPREDPDPLALLSPEEDANGCVERADVGAGGSGPVSEGRRRPRRPVESRDARVD